MSARAPRLPLHTHRRQAERGQGMTEYIIIVAMIAVAAIAVYQYFGQPKRTRFILTAPS